MAQRKRQASANTVDPPNTKQAVEPRHRPLIAPNPPRKRLWFLLITAVALVIWTAFLVAMALD